MVQNIAKSTITHILLICALLVTIRAISLPFGLDQYGYDYGFYSYAVTHTPLDSPAYFLGQVNDYGNHLFMVLNWLGLPQIQSLEFLFLLFSVLASIVFYFYLKKYSLFATALGSSLLILSIPQTLHYSMFLWKGMYGQLLLLLAFLCLQNSKQILALLPTAFLLITHKTTSIIALSSLGLSYLFEVKKYRWVTLGVVLLFALIFLFALNGYEYIQALFKSDIRDGIFMTIKEYLLYSWYLLPLAGYGIWHSIKSRVELHWLSMLVITSLVIIFQGVFHQRLILFADLSLILFSSLTIHYLKLNYTYKIVVILVIAGVALNNLLVFSKDLSPQITQTEIVEIKNFSKNHQGAFVLALSAQDGPWLLANLSGNIRLAAPGLFEDERSLVQWQNFWIQPKNTSFLNLFPQPLYLYEKSSKVYSEPWECLENVSENFYKYICN